MQAFMISHAISPRLLLTAFFCTAALLAAPAFADRTNVSINVGVEIETRGPVHEAFAEPVVYDPDPGLVVPREPPPPIEEAPPDQRPEGDSVSWIPGYWGWDDERSDFIWVSGVWRNIPPGRQFVPGYWAKTGRGCQWVAGSWLGASTQTLEYLPEPPPPQSFDPVGPPPAPDNIWVPGMWIWHHDDYVWRPGYWLAPNVSWTWVPAHYIWTPSGYLFVNGYWDYTVSRRGVLFAPAYIAPAVLSRPAFVYSPTVVIESNLLVDSLFVRARQRCYYFGDYFAPEYERVGIVPVYAFQRGHHGFSALYAQTLAIHVRTEPTWERGFIHQYELRRDRPDARPPRTWVALERARATAGPGRDDDRTRSYAFARPLTEVASARDSRDTSVRFQHVDSDQLDGYRRGRTQLRDYQTQRRQLEQSWADRSPLRSRSADPEPRTPGDRQPSTVRPGPQVPRSAETPRAQPGARSGEKPRADETAQDQPVARKPGASRSLRLNLPRSPVASRRTGERTRTVAPAGRPGTPKPESGDRPAPRVERREPERKSRESERK
jgi:hypothetical protein